MAAAPPERILFAEWGDDLPPLTAAQLSQREPCIICGHPTNDCTTHYPPAAPPAGLHQEE